MPDASCKLFAKNLESKTEAAVVISWFYSNGYGIREVLFPRKGRAILTFDSSAEARRALQDLDKAEINVHQRHLRLSMYIPEGQPEIGTQMTLSEFLQLPSGTKQFAHFVPIQRPMGTKSVEGVSTVTRRPQAFNEVTGDAIATKTTQSARPSSVNSTTEMAIIGEEGVLWTLPWNIGDALNPGRRRQYDDIVSEEEWYQFASRNYTQKQF